MNRRAFFAAACGALMTPKPTYPPYEVMVLRTFEIPNASRVSLLPKRVAKYRITPNRRWEHVRLFGASIGGKA